jgi:hypothetical protein
MLLRSLKAGMPLAAGAAAGLVVATFVAGRAQRPEPPAAADEDPGAERAGVVQPQSPGDELLALRRIERLERQLASRPSSEAEPPARDEDPRTALGREEMMRRQREEHQGYLQRHLSEARDAAWASPMEKKISALLLELPAEVTARLRSGECRSRSCVATVSWPDFGHAQAELQTVLAQLAPTGCAQRVVLPRAPGGPGPVTADAYLDCSSQRDSTQ